jgi:hypothetical protein
VRIVHSADELADVPHEHREPVFAQRYHLPQGRDREIYVIGDEYSREEGSMPRSAWCGTSVLPRSARPTASVRRLMSRPSLARH